ncbi:MAG: dihydroxy-acid dehydratase [Acidobacteria bacterium]|nr:MAG: dihydroxy-acid dehydratase [Acidobacteriota bacterium]
MSTIRTKSLRSYRWYGPDDLRSFGHRSRAASMGCIHADYEGKPVIAIINTWSEINPCHSHLRQRAEDVKRGVWQAGGFPVEMPAITLGETFQKPTTMMYRNLLAMETEELLRSYPVDGCVLLGGCDKTTPALLMGAISMNLPAIFVPAGPMLRGNWRGQILGSGADVMKYWAERRAGTIDREAWMQIEEGIARSAGTCMTMGTASTMTSVAEVLGFSLPGASSIPAVDANHPKMANRSGRRIVEMVWEDLKPRDFLSRASFRNAITTVLALSGSTNAVIHMLALAGRAGIKLGLDDFDELSSTTPVLANLRPSGKYLMEDFYYAGGLSALLKALASHLELSCLTITGKTLGENISPAEIYNSDVIRSLDNPAFSSGGLTILRGNLAPNGAVIKAVAADPALLKHSGRAIVFDSHNEMNARIDDPALDVDANSVLVLRNAGPKGAPGMPEWGNLPIPQKLLKAGVRDMVRISDARMSGTNYGTCVLHVSPESFIGGPLSLLQEGDMVELDVRQRQLNMQVSEEELSHRRAAWRPREGVYPRGYGKLFLQHIRQADEGCDFDFLEGTAPIPEPEIH